MQGEIATYYWLKGTDGNKYTGHNFPHGVKPTGEKELRGYVAKSQQGFSVGPMEATMEAAQENLNKWNQDQAERMAQHKAIWG